MGLKMLCVVVLVCVVQNVLGGHHGGHHWNYAACTGPKTWAGDCKGKAQSPININLTDVGDIGFHEGKKITYHNYWKQPKEVSFTMHNNGHALQFDIPRNTQYKLKTGTNVYVPLQVHIHFDPVTGRGSEHTLNNKKYFAEIHIVHKNAKYTTKKQIMGHKDGLFVIGMFVDRVKPVTRHASDLDFNTYQWTRHNAQVKFPNSGTSFIMKMFGLGTKKCRYPGQSIKIKSFPLAWVLPTVGRKGAKYEYVNYRGSLTTPPCSEIVDWVVITGTTLQVSQGVANIFKSVKNGGRRPMAGNNRPVQRLNGRKLYGVKGML
jgi:carbonic anhydrase